ncbi:uncharacterized protein [Drosophila tropicalis]|uniref:uncharacterized protein n=1 Tax=Drosophila tropicalis TaxID=46794 RepID=UPI0035ABB717
MARTTNLSDLSPKCLLMIFKLLPNLEDQLNLARCCRTLRDVFIHLHQQHFHEIQDRHINLKSFEDWQTFLWLCGENVRSLHSYYDDDHPLQLWPLITKYCTRLESLTIRNATVTRTQSYLLRMTTLQRVHIRNYKSTSKDLIKNILLRLPYIISLGLESFDRRELQELRHFRNLEELLIYDDIQLSGSEFTAITKSMKNLRVLQLGNAKRFLTTSILKQLSSCCPKLEKLSYNDSTADPMCLVNFSQLQYLQIWCPDELKTRFFKALASQCSTHLAFLVLQRKRWINEEQAQHISALRSLRWLVCKPRDNRSVHWLSGLTKLESLSVQCARDIGETELSLLVANNENLCYLNICYCLGITDSFIVDTLVNLAKRQSHNPLELYAAATDIRRDIVERLPTANYPLQMLQVHFEVSDGMLLNDHYFNDEPEFDR